jgi:hypothetical protein
MKRFSIWGREYGANRDTELAQVDNDPQAMVEAFVGKTLKVKHSLLDGKFSRVRRYEYVRFVENLDGQEI